MRVALLSILLVGCAQVPDYIHATPEELRVCAAAVHGCSVWTDEELNAVSAAIVFQAVQYGRALEGGQ